MSVTIKEKNQLVLDVITRLKLALPETTDFTDGSTLKTIVESLMEEVDIQYWQLERTYDSGFLEDTFDLDLDKLVAILGVIRIPALKSKGQATFYRTSPATQNYFIPQGTLIQSLPDLKGKSIKFQTTLDATLLLGQTEIIVNIEALVAGLSGNAPAFTIKTLNTPPNGIELVKNVEATSGGTDKETDLALKNRTQHVLDAAGLGTIDALFNKIANVPGVREVSVQDMARGIGTVNILVLTDSIPMTTLKETEILNIIRTTKAGGIDVLLLEPSVVFVPVTVTLTMKEGYIFNIVEVIVTNAINSYINQLNIGEKLIFNQLGKFILNSSDLIIDINLANPLDNIIIGPTEILRTGLITIS